MTEYVALATFPERGTAFEAYTKLKSTSGLGVEGAAVVQRDDAGNLSIQDGFDADAGVGTGGGALIGMLVGVLGGPLGMLLGASAGALGGSLVDLDRADTADDVLTEFGRQVPVGGTALVVQTAEQETGPFDSFVSGLAGQVTRRPLAEVLTELEAQQSAAEAAAQAARDAAKEQKKQDRQEKYQERIEALRARFGRDG